MLPHCPFNKTQFLQNMLDYFNIITTSPYLATNAVFKTNISFWIRVIFLWGNAVCFAGTISKQNMKYSLKSCTMPFGGVRCAFPDVQPSFQRSSTPFRKVNSSAWYMQYLTMDILQITIFFKRGAAYTKGCYSQNVVRCLGRISHYAFRKMMCNCERHILCAYMYHVFFI